MRAVPLLLAAVCLLAHAAHAGDDVVVHLRADSDAVRIIRIDGDRPEVVCAGLCDKPLPRDGVYQIGGDGIPPTRPFALNPRGTDLTLHVDAGSSGQSLAGALAAVAGGATVIFALGYRAVLGLEDIDSEHHPDRNRDPLYLGSLSAGLVVGLAGLVVLATSGTFVTTSSGVSF